MLNVTYGWHFLPHDKKPRCGDGRAVVAGETLSSPAKPVIRSCGLHSSTDIADALRYADGPILCRVASWGDVERDGAKISARHRRVLWMVDSEKVLREHAAWCAQWALEQELAHGREVDDRSAAATDMAFALAEGNPSKEQIESAWSAAWSAARSAALRAGESAAWSAAESAAWSAAESAAWSAAESAAWSAARRSAWSAARSAALRAGESADESVARSIFGQWLFDAVEAEAKKQGVYVDDYDPR